MPPPLTPSEKATLLLMLSRGFSTIQTVKRHVTHIGNKSHVTRPYSLVDTLKSMVARWTTKIHLAKS